MVSTNGTTVVVESAVWVRTATGWRRAFGHWEATTEAPAVWEVADRTCEDGQVTLVWLTEEQVGAVIVTAPGWTPSKRDQAEAMAAQASADLQTMRVRLHTRAPEGWTSRTP